jgi:hypothetical protein
MIRAFASGTGQDPGSDALSALLLTWRAANTHVQPEVPVEEQCKALTWVPQGEVASAWQNEIEEAIRSSLGST